MPARVSFSHAVVITFAFAHAVVAATSIVAFSHAPVIAFVFLTVAHASAAGIASLAHVRTFGNLLDALKEFFAVLEDFPGVFFHVHRLILCDFDYISHNLICF